MPSVRSSLTERSLPCQSRNQTKKKQKFCAPIPNLDRVLHTMNLHAPRCRSRRPFGVGVTLLTPGAIMHGFRVRCPAPSHTLLKYTTREVDNKQRAIPFPFPVFPFSQKMDQPPNCCPSRDILGRNSCPLVSLHHTTLPQAIS